MSVGIEREGRETPGYLIPLMSFLRAQSGVESAHESGSDVFLVGMRVFACFFFWLVVPEVATNSETLGFCVVAAFR